MCSSQSAVIQTSDLKFLVKDYVKHTEHHLNQLMIKDVDTYGIAYICSRYSGKQDSFVDYLLAKNRVPSHTKPRIPLESEDIKHPLP